MDYSYTCGTHGSGCTTFKVCELEHHRRILLSIAMKPRVYREHCEIVVPQLMKKEYELYTEPDTSPFEFTTLE